MSQHDPIPPKRPDPSAPLPLPPLALNYQAPASSRPIDAQTIFDTVTGPNIRKRDNLIQGIVVLIGGLIGVAVAWYVSKGDDWIPLAVGATVGLFVSVILSGIVIGIVRFVLAVRRRR